MHLMRNVKGLFESSERTTTPVSSGAYSPGVTVHMIRKILKMAYSQQKSYAKNSRRNLQFEVGDKVYLKILPMKGVMRFGKKRNLSHR